MDITQQFKVSVMTVKLERKFNNIPAQDKKRILNRTPRDEFAKQAKDVCTKITMLRNVLTENRAAYMRIGQHLKNACHMTDEQRDLIDRESEKFINYYTQHLARMRTEWKRIKRKSKQQQEHIACVLDLLCDYLKSVQQIFQQQKKYRIQHELETYRLQKLAADKQKIPVRPASDRKSESTSSVSFKSNNASSPSSSDSERIENSSIDANIKRRYNNTNGLHSDSEDDPLEVDIKLHSSQQSQKVALEEDMQKSQQLVDDEVEHTKAISASDDVQVFEEENQQLYQELQGLSEEVELIGKNVVDIAQLQDIFTEKVSMQQHNIERIANAVVGATENVKDANEQIKQAIQRNAGLRVWSLFFLLVMSFALLFLDWYYD